MSALGESGVASYVKPTAGGPSVRNPAFSRTGNTTAEVNRREGGRISTLKKQGLGRSGKGVRDADASRSFQHADLSDSYDQANRERLQALRRQQFSQARKNGARRPVLGRGVLSANFDYEAGLQFAQKYKNYFGGLVPVFA